MLDDADLESRVDTGDDGRVRAFEGNGDCVEVSQRKLRDNNQIHILSSSVAPLVCGQRCSQVGECCVRGMGQVWELTSTTKKYTAIH